MSRRRHGGDHSPAALEQSVRVDDDNDTTGGATSEFHEDCHIVTERLPKRGHMALEVHIADDIGDRIAATSRPYEAVELGIVDALLPQNPTIIDVGANIGSHTICWALTHQAKVTAYEPDAPARQLLCANIARDAVGRLVISQGDALGAGPGGAAPSASRAGNLGAPRCRRPPPKTCRPHP